MVSTSDISTETSWIDQRVLVTGATGLLGQALIPSLRARGATVDEMNRSEVIVSGSGTVACSLGSVSDATRHFSAIPYDRVFHLAAQSQDTDLAPLETFVSNVGATVNLLEAIRVSGKAPAVVCASTYAVGKLRAASSDAEALAGHRPYLASKLCAELIAESYRSTYDMSVGVIRLPNLFGPGDLNFSRLVPQVIQSGLSGAIPPLRSDPNTPINFMFVGDAVDAMVEFSNDVAEEKSGTKTVSIRSQQAMTIGSMVHAILQLIGRLDLLPKSIRESETDGEVRSRAALHTSKDWILRSRISLEAGLAQTIDWYKKNSN